jgi:lysophospholipase L1-like esterase
MRLRRILVCSLVIAIAVCFMWLVDGVRADTQQEPSWFEGQVRFRKLRTIESTNIDNIPCENTVVSVLRSHGLVKESHCMIRTTYGSINRPANVLQPIGAAHAYAIQNNKTGQLLPIPEHPGILRVAGDGFSYGGSLSIYKNFYDTLQLKYLPFMHFEMSDDPDMYFRNEANQIRNVNVPGSLGFSENGRYMFVDDLKAGFLKINLHSYAIESFHDTLPRLNGWGNVLPANGAIANDGNIAALNYNAPNDWGVKYFKLINTQNCQAAIVSGIGKSEKVCQARDILPLAQASIPGMKGIFNVRFTNETTVLFDVKFANNVVASYAATAAGAQYRRVEYLAMGDSFASGQGASNYRDGTDTARNRCHQSQLSYPYLFNVLFESYASVACSGARMVNVARISDKVDEVDQLQGLFEPSDNERVVAREQILPGVVEQIEFISNSNPEVVTLSVGGNDIGFANILSTCASPKKIDNLATCFATYEDRYELVKKINGRFERLRTTYADILRNDPERRLYVIGYPQIADENGSCGVNVLLNHSELVGARDLIEYLNSIIKKAADEAGAHYVDVSDAFAGHKLCESKQVAVNGATTKFDQGKFVEFTESYHPNAFGHQLLAAKIKQQTHSLSTPMPAPNGQQTVAKDLVISSTLPFLQNVPKTGRIIRDIFLDTPNILTIAPVRTTQQVILGALEYNLIPNTKYTAELHSTPINLGIFSTNAAGVLSFSYTVPSNVDPGFHTLHVYGKNKWGENIDIQKTVYVAASEDDIDGDGIVDSQDVCVGVQSSKDTDKDGMPDSCDMFIADPPANSGDANVTVSQNTFVLGNAATLPRATNSQLVVSNSQQVLAYYATESQEIVSSTDSASSPSYIPERKVDKTSTREPSGGRLSIALILSIGFLLAAMFVAVRVIFQ